jgi:hypothetical protein
MYSSSVRPLSELRFFRAATISAGGVGSDGGASEGRGRSEDGAVKA